MFDDLSVDVKDLKIKLPPSVSALFEPVSGVMVLNVADAEFDAMRRNPGDSLVEVFTHEMYHCFQAYTTGYQFKRVCDLRDVLFEEMQARKSLSLLLRYLKGKAVMVFTALLPSALKSHLRVRFYANSLLRDREDLTQLTASGQPSMVGARFPNLHKKLTQAKQAMLVQGDHGLSANDLIEGAAAVYARISYQTTVVTAAQMLEDLSGLSETYTRVLQVTMDACGERALTVMLPSAALALRYEYPENAYVEMMNRILQSQEGAELAAAKQIAADLPRLERAGEALGTAVAAAARIANPTKVYDPQLDAWRSGLWGIDELDLLTLPNAISSIPPGSLGFGMVTRDGNPRGFPDGRGRLMIAAIMLRGGPSINQAQNNVDQDILALSRDLLRKWT